MADKIYFDGFSKLLRKYDREGFIEQQRIKFTYYLCLVLIVFVGFLILNRMFFHPVTIRNDPSHIKILLPQIFLFLSVIVCFIILLKGYYNAAASLIPPILMITMWAVMFMSRDTILTRFDTIVYIFAVLSIIPLLVKRRYIILLIYPLINIVVLAIFLYIFKIKVGITGEEVRDYFIDVSVSLAFVGFIGYNIYRINNNALERAETENKKRAEAESALYKSEKGYREMAHMLPQTVYEADSNKSLTYFNKAGIDMFGYSIEEIKKGLELADLISEEDQERLFFNYQTVKGGIPSHGNKYTGRRKDGSLFPVEVHSSAIIEDGKPSGIRGIIYDISERINAENELRESNELFKTLVDSNPFSIILIGMDGRIILTNNVFTGNTGYSKEELTGKTTEEVGFRIDNNEEVLKELQNTGFLKNYETRVTDRTGKISNVILNISFVDIANNKTMLVTVIDITERKILENKLKESEALFRTMVDMVPYSINIIDKNEHYSLANNAFLKKFNLRLEDIRGKSFNDIGFIMNEKDRDNFYKSYYSNGEITNMEVGFTTPIKEQVYAMMSIKPILIDDEPHSILTTVDITDRKILEDKLLEYNQRLEDLVKERTEELATANSDLKETNIELNNQRERLELTLKKLEEAQSQLIETEKMASLGILTAGVAHEINNPLNYIFNGSVAIENYIKDKFPAQSEELKPLFEAINTGIDRTAEIVKSLNKYSRKEEKAFRSCNIHEIIDNCLTMLFNQYKNRIEIERDYTDQLPLIMGREGKLHQVFLNIITNAVQAIEDKGTITIKTLVINNKLEIHISDTGTGITSENLKNIFDPFFTTKDPGKGTGLGLSITQKIIQEHNGTILCKSKVNKGSEFIINFPGNA
jgi:PAS domain S-box-containing protein